MVSLPAVLIPIKKLNEIQGIRYALDQVYNSRKTKKKLPTLKSFLNES